MHIKTREILNQIYSRLIIYLIIAIIPLTGFTSCNSKPKIKRKPTSSISIKSQGRALTLGDDISISTKSISRGDELTSVAVYINGELISEHSTKVADITLPANKIKVGENRVKLVAINSSGVEGVNYKSFTVLSDIVPEMLMFNVVNQVEHDATHFTQGLEIVDDHLYESTGEHGTSSIYRYNIDGSKILKQVDLEDQYFGEGITVLDNRLYQLTYKKQKGFVYNLETLEQIESFNYPNREGWGLTNDGSHIIMSDGSSTLFYLNPKTLKEERRVSVCDNISAVDYLNELEWVDGYIYANIWTTDKIVKIDAESGKVVAYLDLTGLINLSKYRVVDDIDVLNGIAYNRGSETFLVTGKFWPSIFELKID